jgi:hypothetical protein
MIVAYIGSSLILTKVLSIDGVKGAFKLAPQHAELLGRALAPNMACAMISANPAATSSYRARSVAGQEAHALGFTALIFISSIVLQRIGLISGTVFLSIIGPVGLLIAVFCVMRNTLAINRGRMMIFIALLAWIMAGSVLQAAFPDTFGTPASWMSLVEFIGLSSFGILVFAEPVDERKFFALVNAIFLALAIAGILQFLVQFAGVRLFSFKSFVPASMLLEVPYYNTVIPIGTSGYMKSNGLFLVEPSVFSQFMALAVIIEILMFRRLLFLGAFAVALMASISGTGWLMILSFVLTASFSLGVRGLVLSFITVAISFLAIAVLAITFPSGFELFMSRTSEIYHIGSSGYDRFVTPWHLVGFVFSRAPWAALYGLGPGVSEHLGMAPAWSYNINPPVKIGIEYGIPAFLLYLLYLLTARRTSTQKALLVPVLVLLLLDGGYSMFPPVLFPALVLIMIADLRPSPKS